MAVKSYWIWTDPGGTHACVVSCGLARQLPRIVVPDLPPWHPYWLTQEGLREQLAGSILMACGLPWDLARELTVAFVERFLTPGHTPMVIHQGPISGWLLDCVRFGIPRLEAQEGSTDDAL